MGAAVTHFEVHGKDGATLQKFYADLFDWHVDANNPMNYGMVDTHAGHGINGGVIAFGPVPDDDVPEFVADRAERFDHGHVDGDALVLPPHVGNVYDAVRLRR